NIVCFSVGKAGDSLSEANKKTENMLRVAFKNQGEENKDIFYISKTQLGQNYKELISEFCQNHKIKKDCDDLYLARLTIMNPFVSSKHSKINYVADCIKYLQSII